MKMQPPKSNAPTPISNGNVHHPRICKSMNQEIQEDERSNPTKQQQKYFTITLMFCLALIGCASAPPQSVSVPVAVSCLPAEVPAAPATLADSVLAGLSDYEFVLRIAAERLDLIAYAKQADALISACK